MPLAPRFIAGSAHRNPHKPFQRFAQIAVCSQVALSFPATKGGKARTRFCWSPAFRLLLPCTLRATQSALHSALCIKHVQREQQPASDGLFPASCLPPLNAALHTWSRSRCRAGQRPWPWRASSQDAAHLQRKKHPKRRC